MEDSQASFREPARRLWGPLSTPRSGVSLFPKLIFNPSPNGSWRVGKPNKTHHCWHFSFLLLTRMHGMPEELTEGRQGKIFLLDRGTKWGFSPDIQTSSLGGFGVVLSKSSWENKNVSKVISVAWDWKRKSLLTEENLLLWLGEEWITFIFYSLPSNFVFPWLWGETILFN